VIKIAENQSPGAWLGAVIRFILSTSPLQECLGLTESNVPSVTALSARIVSSFASKNRLSPSELPALIASVRAALDSVGGPAPVEPQEPAVPLRKLISADAVYCAECGAKFKSLKRHLGTEHNLTPHAYIQKWSLKPDHPMVAPNYSATRSALAKSMGLGSGGRKAAAAPAKASKAAAKAPPVAVKAPRRGKAAAAGE
jgi:predicted transcriptional regulator